MIGTQDLHRRPAARIAMRPAIAAALRALPTTRTTLAVPAPNSIALVRLCDEQTREIGDRPGLVALCKVVSKQFEGDCND